MPAPSRPWHALFAPLPDDAVPTRSPVAPPAVLATAEGASVAGWRQLVLHLSAGRDGQRVAMAVVDEGGTAISASDLVLYRRERSGHGAHTGPVVENEQESVGGRLEPDGRFLGKRWRCLAVETAEGEELVRELTTSEPSAEDADWLRALAAELVRRAPPA